MFSEGTWLNKRVDWVQLAFQKGRQKGGRKHMKVLVMCSPNAKAIITGSGRSGAQVLISDK